MSEFADEIAISRSHVNDCFRAELGISASTFLKNEQMKEAKRLLRATNLTKAEIAYRAGFGTRRTFYRAFLRATGMTPDAYRRG